MQSLGGSTLVPELRRAEEINLIGTAEEIKARIAQLADAGVAELGPISFVSDTIEEMNEHVQLFAESVAPAFAGQEAAAQPAAASQLEVR